ncbi:preprotein translocase subunit SecA [Planctomycetes bacterium CA13]|uniref:Preprotein translocase subunit SecA n=1 Tax=Novipirellula herctigrandis TaxID=2527986 RepID=A0A5C5ZAQ3_9BACT|nr:preprotein translocase subunit SecA [Planctomycetes bacterium CA13]
MNRSLLTVLDSVRQSAQNRLGVRLRETQVNAASALLDSCIVEMDTGEGKTLSIALAAIQFASQGHHVDIVTANDYLADRDANWMMRVYQDVGLAVGCVTATSPENEKTSAYAASITYGTIRQFGFDHLQQRLFAKHHPNESNQSKSAATPFDVLIVDEADNVLIDEARTPLLITAATKSIDPSEQAAYRWSAAFALELLPTIDYVRDPLTDQIALTDAGYSRTIHHGMPAELNSMTTTEIVFFVERAIQTNEQLHRDRHYLVVQDQIVLIDEYTGRIQTNRTLGRGLHQALQARESLPITESPKTIARITVQDFVTRFRHLSGITGTAREDRRELQRVYDLPVYRVEPFRPNQRVELAPQVCINQKSKFDAICDEIASVIAKGRAVLVGTRTIEKSERLSDFLKKRNIDHVILNARHTDREADLIATAGNQGRVTVATNMAGRGTDIRLAESVHQSGGLHVIVSEPHAAARIDRQLIGRSARQGDPGSARRYYSPDDEIIEQAYGFEVAANLRQRIGGQTELSWTVQARTQWQITRAQAIVAKQHRKAREELTRQDQTLTNNLVRLGLDPNLDPLD